MILAAGAAYQSSALSITLTGSIWALSVAWVGVGCFLNGRSCGRVHCRIDGIAMPVLSVVALLNVLAVISLSWNLFWAAFWVVLIASFVPELVWKRYS